MTLRWRGREATTGLQVANACDDFVDLAPVSEAPADAVKAAWGPLLSGDEIPLIGEDRYGGFAEEEEC